jgi:hypothetical protein
MPTSAAEDLRLIEHTPDRYAAPFREDGTPCGTFTQTWALVVDGQVYVRAANRQNSRWYRAALAQTAGRVQVGDCGTALRHAFRTMGVAVEAGIHSFDTADVCGGPEQRARIRGAAEA